MPETTPPTLPERKSYVKVTESVMSDLEAAFRVDATVSEACSEAGISRDSYYDHMADDSTLWNGRTFKDRMEKAQAFPFMAMKKVVVKAALGGDGKLAFGWLRSRQRDLYYEKSEQDTKISGGLDLLGLHNAADSSAKAATARMTVVGNVPAIATPSPSLNPNAEQRGSPAGVPQVTAIVRAGHVGDEAAAPQA